MLVYQYFQISFKIFEMNSEPKWLNNKSLLVELAENFKLLEEENNSLRGQLQQKHKQSSNNQLNSDQFKQNLSKEDKVQKDKQKILKLYSYRTWQEFMGWINQKLEESGENIEVMEESKSQDRQASEIKRVLSEILEQPDFEQSYTLQKSEQREQIKKMLECQNEAQLLAIQNAKLRRQNIMLKNKLTQIRALYLQH